MLVGAAVWTLSGWRDVACLRLEGPWTVHGVPTLESAQCHDVDLGAEESNRSTNLAITRF